jgi:hypothetical protein
MNVINKFNIENQIQHHHIWCGREPDTKPSHPTGREPDTELSHSGQEEDRIQNHDIRSRKRNGNRTITSDAGR